MVQSVVINSLWIGGLALLLAAISFNVNLARQQQHALRHQWQQPSFQFAANLSLVLVGAGLAGTAETTVETALWVALALVAAYQAFRSFREWRKGPQEK